MKNIIFLIGLLTYSSVGWTETLIMECFDHKPLVGTAALYGDKGPKFSVGIFKMETDEDSNSPNVITKREDGQWKGNCDKSNRVCTKGDQSVVVVKKDEESKLVFDFRFLNVKMKSVLLNSNTKEKKMKVKEFKCERIE